MKGKGMYTASIALIAVAIISVVSYGIVSTMQQQEQKSMASAIIETKWQWQNAYSLSGKIVSDAIADSVYNSGCTFNLDNIIETIGDGESSGYLKESLLETGTGCRAENVSVASPGPEQASADFDLGCEYSLGGYSLSYAKNGIQFRKQAYAYTDILSGQCFVDVEDLDTGKCEVDTIDTETTLIGCGK